MTDQQAKSLIEAILFMAGEPLGVDAVRKIIEVDKYNTERLLRELMDEYAVRNTGLLIVEVAGGFRMVTNPDCAPWIKKMLSTAVPKRLSQSSLETLAIIAYKQPIIKAEIEAIRGVNSDGVVKTLLERRLIKILGRKEAPGRPLMYGTTQEFLQYFGLKDLSELPTLKEFEEMEIPELPEGSAGGEPEDTPSGDDAEPAESPGETGTHAEKNEAAAAGVTEESSPEDLIETDDRTP